MSKWPSPPMEDGPMNDPTLSRIARTIEGRLAAHFEAVSRPRADDPFSPPESSLLLDQVRDLALRSGKRLRPVLVVCGASLFDAGAEDDEAVLDAAVAMELMHVYLLIHDDIMDEDDTRRGGPSVHAALRAATGDARLGTDLAILCGDLAMALHEGLLARMSAPEPRRRRAADIFSRMHRDVIHGQAMDLLGGSDAEEVARRKTASYTTVGPLMVGGALGGADEGRLVRLGEIGRPLGVAFQLRDDLLGAFGDMDETGKPVGTDLLMGKQTYLIREALRLADPGQLASIRGVLGAGEASAEAVGLALRAIDACGAREACEERMGQLVRGALAAVDREGYLEGGQRFLERVADLLVRRRA
jgi:geranylgeranyl diphosphate synthase type I